MTYLQTLKDLLDEARTGEGVDEVYLSTLRTMYGELAPAGNAVAPSDTDVIQYLRKYQKNVKDNIDKAVRGRREDKLETLKREYDIVDLIVNKFVRTLSKKEVAEIVASLVAETPDLKIGGIMKYFKENYPFRYDPRMVTEEYSIQLGI